VGVRFVIDEQLRVKLLAAILQQNATGGLPIDATQVGDPANLPLGTPDQDLLVWAERNDRFVVTLDRKTMIGHLATHLAAGRHSPGLFLVRRGASLGQIVAFLEVAAHAGDPDDFVDRVTYVS
jgi:hypothetical protein